MYKRLIIYFKEKIYTGQDSTGSFLGFVFTTVFSCSLCIVLNSSFFMSNEKNSSMFTILLANTKALYTILFSRFLLEDNKFTFNIVAGLLISTIGATMFSLKSICDNLITGRSMKKHQPSNEIDLSKVSTPVPDNRN